MPTVEKGFKDRVRPDFNFCTACAGRRVPDALSHVEAASRGGAEIAQATTVWIDDDDRVLSFNSQGELVLARFNPQEYHEQSRAKVIEHEPGLHEDCKKWLEELAPFDAGLSGWDMTGGSPNLCAGGTWGAIVMWPLFWMDRFTAINRAFVGR